MDAGRPYSAHLLAAVGWLDVLVEQVQQRDGVAQPVAQRVIVILPLLDLAANHADDTVEQACTLSLRTGKWKRNQCRENSMIFRLQIVAMTLALKQVCTPSPMEWIQKGQGSPGTRMCAQDS